jgi:hypothetical protein
VCAAILAAALFFAVDALAQTQDAPQTRTLYRWTDAQGRVQYSDKPPVGFKGEVKRVEVDLDVNVRPAAAPRAPLVPADVMRDVAPAPPDMAKARRDTRAKLEEAVRRAESNVALAKAALEGGGEPKEDETNVVRRQYARPQAGKSNCRTVPGNDGQPVIVCPAIVPNDQYSDRQRGLEEALRKAEDELAEAQNAYRRGVD